MSIKPLYLAHGRHVRVRNQDDVLVVRSLGRAASIYPFKRLSRVVSANDVHWRNGALLACLQAGVPVSFIDASGNPLGYCSGIRRRETTLEGLIVQAIEMPCWKSGYSTWLRGMEQQAIRKAIRDTRLHCPNSAPEAARSSFCNAWLNRTGETARVLFKHIDGGLSTYVHQLLCTVFVSSELLSFPLPGLSFVNDIQKILRWPTYALFLMQAKEASMDSSEARRTAIFLQRHEQAIFDQHNEILRRMEIWLRGWVL